ncbi:MAG: anti-CBASS protein Acb1 family protein [Spirochaetia bacterium]
MAPPMPPLTILAVGASHTTLHRVSDILNGNGGVIDEKDSFGLLQNSNNQSQSAKNETEMLYYEIARILKVPITRLIGRSPAGMNATGESDAQNYEKMLNAYRNNWLEPMLNGLDIRFKKRDTFHAQKFKQVVEMHIMLGIEPSPVLVKKVQELGEGL